MKFELLKVGQCSHIECIAMRAGKLGIVDFPALCGLFEHPSKGYMLYDTGYSEHFDSATRNFPECLHRLVTPIELPYKEKLLVQLEQRGIFAKDISTIFISHFHSDHIAGIKDFPKAQFISMKGEYLSVKKLNPLQRLSKAFLSELIPDNFESRIHYVEEMKTIPLPANLHPFQFGYDLLGDETIIGVDLPGHTIAQLGLVFYDHQGRYLFLVGDSCWKIEALIQNSKPSDLARTIFYDPIQYDFTFDNLRKLMSQPNSPKIVPSHCKKTWKELFPL